MKKWICTLSLHAIANFLLAQSPEDLKRLEAFEKQVNTPIVFSVHSTKTIAVRKDLQYDLQDVSRKMDVYLVDDKNPKPLVILIHGKTPIRTNPKNWGVYESWGKLLATEGFVTTAFTHSLALPGKSLEDASLDLDAAITYLKSQWKELSIDTTRIALAAFSAGSPLMSDAVMKQDKNIKALVSFYGFLSIEGIQLYGQVSAATVAKFSLINCIDITTGSFPPIFIAQAGKEHNQGLNQSINNFVSNASIHNIPIAFFNHPTGVHGFDNQNDDARSREIIQSMLNFLHTHVGNRNSDK